MDQRYPDYAYDYQLNIYNVCVERTLKWAPDQEIVYKDLKRFTYCDFFHRVGKLAYLYQSLGIKDGDIIGVMDWDSHRYLENYLAVPMMGATLHTINVRLSPELILYTINHAEDKVLVVNEDFFKIIEAIGSQLETVQYIIVIKERQPDAILPLPQVIGEYEALLAAVNQEFQFNEDLDENRVATLFYTTGTSGLYPKGVYYTHKQMVLHSFSLAMLHSAFHYPASLNYSDVYMPLTPMFHVHAWGYPFIATMYGLKQVYPGQYEVDKIIDLIKGEGITFSHCVPTILSMILNNPRSREIENRGWKTLVGGSPLTKALCKEAWEKGIKVCTGYGMSETNGTLCRTNLKPSLFNLSDDQKYDIYCKTGFPIPNNKVKIVDENMDELPPGKQHQGEIIARAPWLTKGYYKSEELSKELWQGGWMHTGDIGYKDEEGYVTITDRLKDVIKSGGEWISSIELENLISMHKAVAESAVVGVPDEKWGERPVAYVVLKEEYIGRITAEELKGHLHNMIEKWAIPDKYVFTDEIPKTSVGKINKKLIRAQYQA